MRYPDGWEDVEHALERSYGFRDFAEAMRFVNRLAEEAERQDHHPDISISWNKVTVRWWTHVKAAITERDVEMAQRTDDLAGQREGSSGDSSSSSLSE